MILVQHLFGKCPSVEQFTGNSLNLVKNLNQVVIKAIIFYVEGDAWGDLKPVRKDN